MFEQGSNLAWLNTIFDQLQFSSLEDFIAMGNHGLYVWLSYGVGMIALTSILAAPKLRRRAILKDLAQRNRRAQLSNAQRNNETQHNTSDPSAS